LREQLGGVGDGLLGIGRRKGRHHRDLIGCEQPFDLDRIKPVPAIGERRGNDFSRGIDFGRGLAGHGGRDLRQGLNHLAMPNQMHEASNRIVFGGVVGNACAAQQFDDLLIRPDPQTRAPAWPSHGVVGDTC
jgi:hypothetical protein